MRKKGGKGKEKGEERMLELIPFFHLHSDREKGKGINAEEGEDRRLNEVRGGGRGEKGPSLYTPRRAIERNQKRKKEEKKGGRKSRRFLSIYLQRKGRKEGGKRGGKLVLFLLYVPG